MIIKLRNRLIATIMAFVSIIMLVAFISIYMVTFLRTYNENMEKVNSEEVITVSTDGQMIIEGQMITDAFVVNRISPSLGVYFNLIIDTYGNPIWIDSALTLKMEDYELAADTVMKNQNGGTIDFAGRKWQYTIVEADELQLDLDGSATLDDLKFIRFLDITDSNQMLETLVVTLIGLYCVLMIVFFFLARYFANRSIRPMAEAWESQRQFVADASHELKTPISTLNANLDILYASQEDTIQAQIKWVDNSKKVLSRMTALIQSMLELARMDEGAHQYKLEDVCMNDLLDEVTDSYMPLTNKKNISTLENIDLNLHVHSNYGMIQQIVEILMDNAVKYTSEDGEIHISAHEEKGRVLISIQNTGEGISPADIDKVFERFHRGDKARVYEEGNYGLGLSIAKRLAEKLGGKIEVQSNSRLTSFTVTIPSKKTPRS